MKDLNNVQQKRVEKYLDLVPAVLWSTIYNHQQYSYMDYEDLLQEGNLALCRASMQYSAEKGATFKTYAWKCIRNALFSSMKKLNLHKTKTINKDHDFLQTENQIWDQIASLELQMAIENIKLHATDDTTKIGITAFIYQNEGLTIKDISKQIQKDPNYIRACCSRARKKIKNQMEK